MVATDEWVFLVYQLPREPSTPRITVWRTLKRLGVAQLSDGLVALPYDAVTKEQLEWVAQDVTDAGGHSTVWITRPAVRRFGRELAQALAADRAREYRQIAVGAGSRLDDAPVGRRRAVRQLRARLRRVERRDHFPPPERVEAQQAVERLAASIDRVDA